MPGIQLLGGDGVQYPMGVTKDNEAKVLSNSRSVTASKSIKGDSYILATPFLTITTTAGVIFYIKNTSATQNFHVEDFYFSWDGGSTNFNRPCEAILRVGDSAPTANNTASVSGNMNFSSGKTASLDFEYWDEVGTGMTITGGIPVGYSILTQGWKTVNAYGAIILGQGDTLSFSARGIETGEVGIGLFGYFEDRD